MSRLTTGNKYKSQLLQLREARRNVDRDAQLLANRIALLEAEEEKSVEENSKHQGKSRGHFTYQTRKQRRENDGQAKDCNEPGEAEFGRQILGTGNFTSKPEQGTKAKRRESAERS